MLNFQNVWNLQLVLFSLMLTGFFLRRRGIVGAGGRTVLTDLLIDVILPCNIVVSFMIRMSVKILTAAGLALLIAFFVQIACWLLGKVIYRGCPLPQRQVLRYATMCSNAGFMGNPIIQGLYGSLGLLYASVYLIPLRFFMWSAGLSCFTRTSLKSAFKKLALHPCIIAVWVGFALMLTQFQPPAFAAQTIRALSGCTLPVSTLIIGTILAEIDFHALLDGSVLFFCLVRLFAIPAALFGVCRLLSLDPLVTAVSVVLSGMPAGSTTAILAEKYDGDAKYASKCVFFSTLLSLGTIPLLCLFLERF